MRSFVSVFLMFVFALIVIPAEPVHADALVFNQGFEVNTIDWQDASTGWEGTVTRVASGTNGIASSSGSFHAQMTQGTSGPFTRFGGYNSVWPNGFTTSADFFVDMQWGIGAGFDYSVAANTTANTHRRDFIFHVGRQADGSVRVGASNNTNFNTRMDLATINNYSFLTTGWYTFQQRFYDMGGVLAVDMVVLQGNSQLFSRTLSNPTDLIGLIGGNRYGWLTHTDGTQFVAVDNVQLVNGTSVPEPTSLALLGIGLIGGAMRRFKRQN